MSAKIDAYFGLTEARTSIRQEAMGGLTTFLAMAYILFVQPSILGQAGMDQGAVLTATCLASALATLLMGLWARHPVALAPGMGLNAFFAFVVCGTLGIEWRQALGLVLCSGVLFMLLGLFRLREHQSFLWAVHERRHGSPRITAPGSGRPVGPTWVRHVVQHHG